MVEEIIMRTFLEHALLDLPTLTVSLPYRFIDNDEEHKPNNTVSIHRESFSRVLVERTGKFTQKK